MCPKYVYFLFPPVGKFLFFCDLVHLVLIGLLFCLLIIHLQVYGSPTFLQPVSYTFSLLSRSILQRSALYYIIVVHTSTSIILRRWRSVSFQLFFFSPRKYALKHMFTITVGFVVYPKWIQFCTCSTVSLSIKISFYYVFLIYITRVLFVLISYFYLSLLIDVIRKLADIFRVVCTHRSAVCMSQIGNWLASYLDSIMITFDLIIIFLKYIMCWIWKQDTCLSNAIEYFCESFSVIFVPSVGGLWIIVESFKFQVALLPRSLDVLIRSADPCLVNSNSHTFL